MGDWVNEEELDIRDGYRWSDDSRSLAYWQFDTSGVGEFTLVNTAGGTYPVLQQFAYPKVGTRNSAVRIGVVAASGGRTRWLKLPGDPREHYVSRLEWAKGAGQLVVHRLNRLQNTLDVFLAEARTGEVAAWWQDRDEAWVSVRDAPRWTRDGQTMVILSERGGWQQAYAVSRADRSTRLLTPSAADVISLLSTDAKDEWLYYLASPDNATQRYLFRSRLDGSGATERVTPAAQPGTHSYSISPDGSFAFHTYSTFNQPPVTRLVRLPSHEVVRLLEENRALREKNADLGPPGEFLTVAAGDGVTLDGWMIKPKAFEPGGKYPVVVFVYGEPASVTVTDNWGGSRTLFHRALAEAGFAVVSFDNRGTPAPKGRAWRKVIYGAVNVLAAKEQTTALQNLLRERPYLDASRVGVWGHSGGGANTLNLMFRSPETYQVGVSLAPVVDQRLYDTIYQERYMGLPAQNPDGYRDASPITHAAGLRGKLLLVHGAADDNVHYQHSEQLINRLIELQKPVDLMVYPSGTHALSEGKGYALHRHRLIAHYFVKHLAPAPPAIPGGG
jgi:dipeptidyl-peptidase-4